jgi:hypothetical protein
MTIPPATVRILIAITRAWGERSKAAWKQACPLEETAVERQRVHQFGVHQLRLFNYAFESFPIEVQGGKGP